MGSPAMPVSLKNKGSLSLCFFGTPLSLGTALPRVSTTNERLEGLRRLNGCYPGERAVLSRLAVVNAFCPFTGSK